MVFSRNLLKMLAASMLLVTLAVFMHGVFHDIFHEAEENLKCTAASLIAEHEHNGDCHSNHHNCSRLSCSHGELFLAAAMFLLPTADQTEKFVFFESCFRIPLVIGSLFKPPITFAC